MNSEKLKNVIRDLLLIFVFVTFGFSLGRYTALQEQVQQSPESSEVVERKTTSEETAEEIKELNVFTTHSSFRCFDCNQIENLTRNLLETEFKQELESGQITYKSVNYMQDRAFVNQYNVVLSTVVLSLNIDSKEVGFKSMDSSELFKKIRNRDEFLSYLREEIKKALSGDFS